MKTLKGFMSDTVDAIVLIVFQTIVIMCINAITHGSLSCWVLWALSIVIYKNLKRLIFAAARTAKRYISKRKEKSRCIL